MILTIPAHLIGMAYDLNVVLSIHTPMIVRLYDAKIEYPYGDKKQQINFRNKSTAMEYFKKFDLYLSHDPITEPELFL